MAFVPNVQSLCTKLIELIIILYQYFIITMNKKLLSFAAIVAMITAPQSVLADTFSEIVNAQLTATADGGTATVTLDQDYTLDAAISVPYNKQLVIDGANHILTVGGGSFNFTTLNGITLKNLKIDATNLTDALIILPAGTSDVPKNKTMYTDADWSAYYMASPVEVENCMIKNLKNSLVTVKANWAIETFNLKNNII